jgi:hypothetical protein
MNPTKLPHALGETVVRGFPNHVLHVATTLAENYGESGFNAQAKHALLQAVARRVYADGLGAYRIHWNYGRE